MKQIPKHERPRERLINEGAKSLSNEELLSILLKTGTKNMSVKELALSLLHEVGNIQQLRFVKLEQLLKLPGVGPTKASELLACVELSKRMHQSIYPIKGVSINNSELVFTYYQPKLKDEMQECFYKQKNDKLVLRNGQHRILKHLRYLLSGHDMAECGGAGNNRHYRSYPYNGVSQYYQHLLECERFVYERCNNDRINQCNCRALCRGSYAGENADQNDYGHYQRKDSAFESLPLLLPARPCMLREIALFGTQSYHYDQSYCHQDSRDDACHEKLRYRDACKSAIDYKRSARRDYWPHSTRRSN